MRTLHILIFTMVLVLSSSCVCYKKNLIYSGEVINIGKSEIEVDNIQLLKKNNGYNFNSTIRASQYRYGWTSGVGPFRFVPNKSVIVRWRKINDKKIFEQKVSVKIPLEFYIEGYPSQAIIFCIDSDKNKVYVAYRIISFKKRAYVIVNSEGKSFFKDLEFIKTQGENNIYRPQSW